MSITAIPTLLNMAILKIVDMMSTLHMDISDQMSFLTPNLKDAIRTILLKRKVTGKQLKHLLHKNVKDLDLRDCLKTKQIVQAMEDCKQLRKFNINCHQTEQQIEDISSDLCKILQNNFALGSVSMRNLVWVNDFVLQSVQKNVVEIDIR